MLVKHGGSSRRGTFRVTAQSIFTIVRDGILDLNDAEYEELLRQADGKYWDFEEVFGVPSINKEITSAPAFRWACDQLDRRIDQNKWCEIWGKVWHDTGVLKKLCTEHSKIKPDLELILGSLKSEKAKLEHTAFPLKSNISLCLKYDEVLELVEVLLEYGGLQRVEWFSETSNQENLPHLDIITLVLYSMGIAFLINECLQSVYRTQNE